MKSPSYIFLLLVLVLSDISPVAANPAMDWIQKMSNAMRDLSYQGNFVYLHDGHLESMEVTHVKDSSGERERLFSLNGEAREVIRNNKNLTCIWPSSKQVVVDDIRQSRFSPISIPKDIVRLGNFYEMKLLGKDRIADTATMVVLITPTDNLRYGKKFWIDEKNGLMMKSSLLDDRNREIEQVMFTSMDLVDGNTNLMLDAISKFDESFALIRYHSGDGSEVYSSDTSWRLNNIPRGFWREAAVIRQLHGTGSFIQQMVYTDGLASLSVFIERDSSGTSGGGTSMGAVNAFIRIVNGHSVTAIGEVPAITVKQLADSVSYQQQ